MANPYIAHCRKRDEQRSNLAYVYEMAKSAWLVRNPNATPEEYQRAMTELARKIGV